ncbi:MAG: hypothetical protein ACYTEK_21705 [Planctomycetota bacterium]|jgi:hypothetical protein
MNTKAVNPDLEYYIGKLQPQYESEGQAKIGRMLDEYGIPFFYRQATMVCDNGRRTIWRPDFTLPTYNNAVIEYSPNGAYSPGAGSKSDLARRNNIAALFLNRSDLAKPDWQRWLYEKLEEMYHQPFARRDSRNAQARY